MFSQVKPPKSARNPTTATRAATRTLLGPPYNVERQERSGVRLSLTGVSELLKPVGSLVERKIPVVARVAAKVTSRATELANKLINMFTSTPTIDEDDIIFDALNDDNLSERFFMKNVQSIKDYIETNPATVADIENRFRNEVLNRTRQEPQNADVSTLVHIIIDYMYSNSVDFSDTTYTDEQLNQFLAESAIEERPDGLLDPVDVVYSDAKAEFKNLVPRISPEEFTERLNSAGILGLFYPIYDDEVPSVEYDRVRGQQIFDAMQAAEKLIRTELLEKYTQISIQKLKEESAQLNELGVATQRALIAQQELEKMERAVEGQRVLVKTSSDDMNRFITEQTKKIAAKAIAVVPAAAQGLASNAPAVKAAIKSMQQSGGKKIIHKSKNARKSNKSKKTTKKTTKKRTKSKSKSNKNRK